MSPTAVADRPEIKPTPAAFEALDEKFERLPIDDVVPSHTNPRTHFDHAYLEQLAASFREKGIVEPLLVRPFPAKRAGIVEIVAGECRYRAARKAGLTHVPCLIRALTNEQALEIQLIENIHRRDLTPLEEAAGFRALIKANPDKHSAATIAERIGKSASWVWDLMKLLELIPEAKTLLEDGRMAMGHAIPIARLKPEDQKRIIHPENGGLFESEDAQLDLAGEDGETRKRGKYDGYKVRTIREVQDWIADHVRFDITHAAKAAPLEFEAAAAQVEAREALAGRGKKVIPITYSHFCPDHAKDEDERTFGYTAWRRADGQQKSKVCEFAVLGVVAAGAEGYGETFDVCIAREKCHVHWDKEIKAKAQTEKLRTSGKEKQADKRESAARERAAREQRRTQLQRERGQVLGAAIEKAADAQLAKIKKATPALLALALAELRFPKTPVSGLAEMLVEQAYEEVNWQWDEKNAGVWAKALGVDVKAIERELFKAEAVQGSGLAKKAKKGKAA